jgi:biofilm PGA synthesis N-glycosyltransferase PgaC
VAKHLSGIPGGTTNVEQNSSGYVLVTPARNEETTLATTIESVINQTIPPREWIIVSDQSTDRTDAIVKEYSARVPYLRLLRLEQRPQRSFASVVFVTEAGVQALQTKDYQFIGLLDADIRFPANYYEGMLQRFATEPGLGLAGGLVMDCIGGKRHRAGKSLLDVAGAVQFFRRECFESLGGLVPLPEGGWDTITCAQARMHGFITRTFEDLEVDHLKPRNIAEGDVLKRYRQLGVRGYAVGNHPLFEVTKCAYRCLQPPFLIGGTMRLAGFVGCYLRGRKRHLSGEIIRFIREEQLRRLFRMKPAPASRSKAREFSQV